MQKAVFLIICLPFLASAQVPSVTGSSLIKFREGNNVFARTVNDVFGAIDVSLTTGVTGTLPVANGGTGATTFTNNRLLTGNGTSAIVDESNLTFDGTTLTLTGKQQVNTTASYSTSQNFVNVSGTVTSTALSLGHRGVNAQLTYANDGSVANGSLYGLVGELTFSGSTNAPSNNVGVFGTATNSSANVGTLYGTYARITEQYDAGSLSNRYAGRYECNFSGAGDYHTGYGFYGDVVATSTGRWLTGVGAFGRANNAKTSYGAQFISTNSRGTANTQRGIQIQNLVSGSGVVVDNAYGIDLVATASASGAFTTYYGLYTASSPPATTNYLLFASGSGWRSYLNGSLSLGVNDNGAQLVVRGTGNTSGTTALKVENSSSTDAFLIYDDGTSAFGTTPVSTQAVTVRGATSDNTTKALVVERASGTDVLGVQNDGKVSINNAAYTEELTINGQAQLDGVIFTSQTSSITASGHLAYNNGSGGTHSGYLTVGDGTRQLAVMPTTIERQCIDYNVDWTLARTKGFWTVPARYNGWKIAKAYIEVSAIGTGAGDDVLDIEIGGVTIGTQTITAGSHTLVLDDAIATDDIVTFFPTALSAVPAKGLNVSLELSKN